mmetsp:Transcript_17346/g.29165  ORF Transcript_17346/g.29165 Transcript_17346/m.29165 type:complete len:88 (+) Transcript_17346:1127-1390(+)
MTHLDLIRAYEANGRPKIDEGMEVRNARYRLIDTNFQEFAENRKSSSCSQFLSIFTRNFQFLFRNKKSFASIFLNALFIGSIMLAVF